MSDVAWHQCMVNNTDVAAGVAEAVKRRFSAPVESVTVLQRGLQGRRCACEKVWVEKGRTVRDVEANGVTYAVRWDFEYCTQCNCAWYWVPEKRAVYPTPKGEAV